MSKNVLLIVCIAMLSVGCGSSSQPNSNMAANAIVNLDPANLPPGLSTSPMPPSGNTTPGIPANPMQLPKGATPTPGIPSEEEIKRQMNQKPKPGATPTPGIPSEAEIRRQMQGQTNMNTAPAGNVDMRMRSNKRVNKP